VKSRFAALIASVGILFTVPAGALASGSTTTTSSQITPTAPSRLTTSSPTVTTVSSDSTGTTGHATTLPNTGYDLFPETLIGFVLVGVGVGLKLRRSRA
jgi:hypothetical protein